MLETPFIITVDTEGDNLWAQPREITTRNAEYLPRFQSLCEKFRFKPVYLVNHEMAMSDVFVDFGRDVVSRGVGEIGMHLHAWNSPPVQPLTGDDFRHQPFLIEYPDRTMKEKIHVMTELLQERFDRKMVSHRAGRWAFDGRYAAMLLDEGYLVDCSVTPGVDWRATAGDPNGKGGSDYTSFPESPYFIDPTDISVASTGTLLEVPMTVIASRLFRWSPAFYQVPILSRLARKLSPARSWLCPVPLLEKHNDEAMHRVVHAVRNKGAAHMEFMLHSSELMPGGSPSFRSSSDIDRLYARMEMVFEEISTWCQAMTLKEFREWWIKSPGKTGTSGLEDKRMPSIPGGESAVGAAALGKQAVAG